MTKQDKTGRDEKCHSIFTFIRVFLEKLWYINKIIKYNWKIDNALSLI